MQHHPAPDPTQPLAPEAEQVAAYLRAHPGFLADHPALYEHLVPPNRLHGPVFADHMQAMLHQARARAADAERAASQTATTRRAAESFTRRVQDTVLALMRAPDPAWLATHELASLLHLDAARICSEAPQPPADAASIPRGTVAATLGQRPALVRTAHPDPMLHGEAVALATEEALIRIPLTPSPALLALAARDATGLDGATTDALAFLGQALAAALEAPE